MNKNIKLSLSICAILFVILILIVGLGSALFPLLTAFLFAYLFFPIVQYFEKKGINRLYSVSILFLCSSLIFVGLVLFYVPHFISEFISFVNDLPKTAQNALTTLEKFAQSYGFEVDISKIKIKDFISSQLNNLSGQFAKDLTSSLQNIFSGTVSWIVTFLNISLIPVFFFFLILDFEKITTELYSFTPKQFQPKLNYYLKITDRVLSGYIRGQLIVCGIMGCLYALGFSIIGLKYGFLIGLLTGFLNFIPYAGPTFGFVTATLIALANYTGFGVIVGIIIVFIIVQTLEGFVITPKLVGDKVGLNSLSTILVLIIGGNLLGFLGMIIAIPTAGVLKYVLADIKRQYLQKSSNTL